MPRNRRKKTYANNFPLSQEELDSSLSSAIHRHKWDEVKELAEEGADIHQQDELLLREAIKAEQPADYIHWIIAQNTNIHIMNDCVLTLATQNNDLETLELLFKYNAKLSEQNSIAFEKDAIEQDRTCDAENLLHEVIIAGADAIDCYLSHDQNLRIHNDKALFYAAARQNDQVFQRLLQHGADVNNVQKWIDRFADIRPPQEFNLFTEKSHRKILGYSKSAQEYLSNHLKKEAELSDLFNRYSKRYLSKIDITHQIINYDASLIHLSAKSGKFALLVNKAIKENQVKQLSYANLCLKDQHGKSVIDYLKETGTIESIFKPEIWVFQKNKLNNMLDTLPDTPHYKKLTNRFFQEFKQLELSKKGRTLQLKRRKSI